MASSVLTNFVVSHTVQEEYLSVSFTTATSVASIAHSFTGSFAKTPLIVGGVADQNDGINAWVESRSATGATFAVRSDTAAQGSIQADFIIKPDLS